MAEQSKDSRLMRDYLSMQELRKKTSLINFVTNCKDSSYPTTYLLEFNITSVIGIYSNNKPVIAEIFRFNVSYSSKYPFKPIFKLEKNSNEIFHPHIDYRNPKTIIHTSDSKWIDYTAYNPEENLADIVIRIAKSLQFNIDFIKEDVAIIANEAALNWFQNFKRTEPQNLPIDKVDILNLQNENTTELRRFNVSQQIEQPKKRFDVTNRTIGFRPTNSIKPKVDIINPLSNIRNNYNPNKAIYILPNARQQIFSHINWGSSSEQNRLEQGGILLGNVHIDMENNFTYGIIEEVIVAEFTTSNSIHLNMTHETWNTMLLKADNLIRSRSNLFLVGWYHTHPNQLDVFMSNTDVETQKRLFSNEWNFAVVLNPHSKIWRAFYGANALECQGFFIENFVVEPVPST